MNLTLLGAPGAGKGTQAKKLAQKYHLSHISTGDILRQAIKEGTPLGKQAEHYLKSGELVPDAIMLGIIEERLNQPDARSGAIFDGFPRTLLQADGLEALLKKSNNRLDLSLSLEVPDELIIQRLSSRRICSNCGADYNVITNPPPPDGKCLKCGGPIVQRADDEEGTIRNRLAVYRRQTKPLQDYYSGRGLLRVVDGHETVNAIFAKLCRTVDDYLKESKGN
jgi:adenylate kinase